MQTILEEVTPETAEILATQARARGLSVDEYLKNLLNVTKQESTTAYPTLAEFEADMEAFSEGTEHLIPESLTYSRRDIYFNHD